MHKFPAESYELQKYIHLAQTIFLRHPKRRTWEVQSHNILSMIPENQEATLQNSKNESTKSMISNPISEKNKRIDLLLHTRIKYYISKNVCQNLSWSHLYPVLSFKCISWYTWHKEKLQT